jgi:hypothetical protein
MFGKGVVHVVVGSRPEKQKDIFDINNIKYIFQVPSCPRTNSMASTDFDEDDDDEEDDDELTDGYYLFRCLLIK